MSNIYFMCENCGIETNGITFVNGMKFCAKCYHQIFGKDNQQTEITQLKQQLAEKDKEINSLIVDYEKRISQEQELMSNMEQQLAEKDEEIERLKVFEKAYYYNQLQASQEDIQKFQNLTNQSAININYIAIQELEKVNGILTDTIIEVTQNEFDINKLCYLEEISAKFYEKIQQQIKELKGEKDVKD